MSATRTCQTFKNGDSIHHKHIVLVNYFFMLQWSPKSTKAWWWQSFCFFSYTCTKVGTVFEINYELMVIHKVRRLLPIGSRQDVVGEHVTPSGLFGTGINCLSVNEAFCVTGSDDGYLRLWPLDFSGVVLEAGNPLHVSLVTLLPYFKALHSFTLRKRNFYVMTLLLFTLRHSMLFSVITPPFCSHRTYPSSHMKI